ncbi:MAG: aldo/keto reductase [Candidatus Rifleibacteriota bacterium]
MEYVKLPSTDFNLSRVSLGTWAIGGWMWGGTDEQASIKTIHSALDRGINLIDTAPVYGFGRSEEITGKAIKEYGKRENIYISTKAGLEWNNDNVFRNSTRARIFKEIEDSLKRLQTDYIDIYYIHWPDPLVDFEETAMAMKELLNQGKIRAIGVSNYNPQQMLAFEKTTPIHFCQPPYNIFERGIENDIKPYCEEKGIKLMTYGALCRGLLSGKMTKDREFKGDDLRKIDPKFQGERFEQYLAATEKLKNLASDFNKSLLAFSVRWILDQGVDIALWGGRKPEHMQPTDEIWGWQIDEKTKSKVNEILQQTISNPVGPEFMAPPSREKVAQATSSNQA